MKINLKSGWVTALGICALGGAIPAAAAGESAMTFTLDNDILTGSDDNYTNGFGLTYVSADIDSYGEDSFIRKWSKAWSFLPFVGDEGYATYASWTVAQEMHTPDDIDDPNPPLDGQPYAGVLYIDSMLYARKGRWAHSWQLKLGVVGPSSGAGRLQEDVHEFIGMDEPAGWDTQLPDEPVINVGYTAAYLTGQGQVGETAEWRVISLANAGLGTYFTGAGLGVYGEVGWNLVDAFGGSSIRSGLNAASTVGVGPVDGWSVSFFGGVGAYGVAHYLPLDGNVFRDSRSVDTKPFVGTGSFGMSLRHHGLVVSLAATLLTDTAENQDQTVEFGTLSVSWNH